MNGNGTLKRVFIVEDHAPTRELLRRLVDDQPDMVAIGEAETGKQALRRIRKERPDVVLMDIELPRLDGITATRRLARELPGVKVVAVSTHAYKLYVREMILAGASAYLLKERVIHELPAAIRFVMEDQMYFGSGIDYCVLEGVAKG